MVFFYLERAKEETSETSSPANLISFSFSFSFSLGKIKKDERDKMRYNMLEL